MLDIYVNKDLVNWYNKMLDGGIYCKVRMIIYL